MCFVLVSFANNGAVNSFACITNEKEERRYIKITKSWTIESFTEPKPGNKTVQGQKETIHQNVGVIEGHPVDQNQTPTEGGKMTLAIVGNKISAVFTGNWRHSEKWCGDLEISQNFTELLPKKDVKKETDEAVTVTANES